MIFNIYFLYYEQLKKNQTRKMHKEHREKYEEN